MSDDTTTRRRTLIERLLRPASLLIASFAIIAVTAAIVLVGALVIYRYDGSEFGTYGEALWFTLQTATTVGYGDMTPQRTIGRVVAAVVMLVSLALLTVLTATITSYFIERATQFGKQARHDEITLTLARLEASVAALHDEIDDMRRTPGASDGGRGETTGQPAIRP